MSIDGIKSIDFLLTATGEGVINHNGSFPMWSPTAKKKVGNHLFPKMRGFDPFQRVREERDGQELSMMIRGDDPAIGSAALVVSAACIRSGLFRDISHGLQEVTVDNADRVLASLHGLVRGYLITRGKRNMARKSALYVTDFECTKPGLAFAQGSNQHTRGTERENTSLYSYYATAKDLVYTGKASLSVEDLQYIALEDSLGRSSLDYETTIAEGTRIAQGITDHLRLLAPSGCLPTARFVKKAVRRGAIEPVGDAGVLLDDDAVKVVASEIRQLFENLTIRQGKGYLSVTKVGVDYNDSARLFRQVDSPDEIVDTPSMPFAQYYAEEAVSDAEFEAAQGQQATARAARAARAAPTGAPVAKKATSKKVSGAKTSSARERS